MSIIVGYQTPNETLLISDTAVTYGDSIQRSMNDAKLFEIGPGVFVGGCGSMAAVAMLKHFNRPAKFSTEGEVLDYLMDYYKYLEQFGMRVFGEDNFEVDTSLFFATADNLWDIDGYMIMREPLVVIGSCESSVRTALDCGATPEQAIREAIKYDPYCGLPLKVIRIDRTTNETETTYLK